MQAQDPELFKKIRQQFESAPYPRIPLEKSPKHNYELLYIHNYVTAYYLRNQKVINTEGKVILDAGCGTGYKSLVLAEANPGAKIVGIDISEPSVELASQRLKYHGFENVEFNVLSVEELPKLDYQFDLINIDEVLYLFPDIVLALKSMKSVLKPDGIIRANLHSSLQRTNYFRVQSLFKMMGFMDENPGEMEIELARETIMALKDQVLLKSQAWNSEKSKDPEWVLMNYLFQGDKGFTIPEIFAALRNVDLEFISMVNWRQWDIMDLFKEPDNLPAFLGMSLPEATVEERLHLFELLHPVHRLLDFWCGHPDSAVSYVPISEWTDADWETVQVHLHPQLRTAGAKEDLVNCIKNYRPFEISQYIQLPTLVSLHIESSRAACLLPLWEGKQSFLTLVDRWLRIKPYDSVTLEPISQQRAFDEVKEVLSDEEPFLYVLLERSGLS